MTATLWAFVIGGGVVALSALLLYRHGRRTERQGQTIDDLEFGADIRRRADEAEQRHDADMAQLPDDPDERRAALIERMRAKGRIRD